MLVHSITITIMLKVLVLIGKREEIVTHLPEKGLRIWTGIIEGHYPRVVLSRLVLTESSCLIDCLIKTLDFSIPVSDFILVW